MIVLDATPLASGHGVRGIGRYLQGVVTALATAEPEFVEAHIRLLVTAKQATPPGTWQTITTLRSPTRPQDLGWAVAGVADRRAAHGLEAPWWHQTDPMLPWSPVRRSRTMTMAYDLIPLHEAEVWAGIRPHRRLVYRRYLDALRRARAVIAISTATAADLQQTLGVPADRIRIVPPAIVAPPSTEPIPPDPEAPFLLFVGVADPHKRPELALETLAALGRRRPGASLAFVGPSPENRIEGLRRRAAALGIADAIDFRGAVSDDELTALYRSGVLLAVSRIEGFGLPPVEAILAGGRAVAVPIEIYREVLGSAATYAVADEAEAIADAVEDSLANPATDLERVALASRFSPAAAAAALRATYEELTA